jgi:hypothetical protein
MPSETGEPDPYIRASKPLRPRRRSLPEFDGPGNERLKPVFQASITCAYDADPSKQGSADHVWEGLRPQIRPPVGTARHKGGPTATRASQALKVASFYLIDLYQFL